MIQLYRYTKSVLAFCLCILSVLESGNLFSAPPPICFPTELPSATTLEAIPEWALDWHTRQGRAKGSTLNYFLTTGLTMNAAAATPEPFKAAAMFVYTTAPSIYGNERNARARSLLKVVQKKNIFSYIIFFLIFIFFS